jgi:hypothetical protein
MISVLVPTRKRPDGMHRLIDSLRATSFNLPEILCYIDDDDSSYGVLDFPEVRFIVGERMIFSDMWNKCAEISNGEILMMAADDMVFRTPDWDVMIEEEYAKSPDKILMVHGDDLGFGRDKFGVFPTIHRRWVDAVGSFCPPGYSADYCDTHLNDVANAIDRRRFLPYVTEHLHVALGKASWDDTYREARARDANDNNANLYAERIQERIVDAEKLRKVMNG